MIAAATIMNDKTTFYFEKVLFNEITFHVFFNEIVTVFINLLNEYFSIWTDQDFVKLSKENWMRLSLKTDWKTKIKRKVKIYSLSARDKNVIDTTFNELQNQNKLSYTTKATSFNLSCFVVWKESVEKKKKRVVMNIRKLNAVLQSNAYSISLQFEILQAVQNCIYIFVIDCAVFFYQWKMHSSNKHKLIVIIHREQKTFNVIVMKYRNFSFYVQRQINRILRSYRFAKTYMNDIVIFFKTLQKHLNHLRQIFDVLSVNNISMNSNKAYIEYSSVNLLKQHVNFFELVTKNQKLKIIAKFTFLVILN